MIISGNIRKDYCIEVSERYGDTIEGGFNRVQSLVKNFSRTSSQFTTLVPTGFLLVLVTCM